jgi:spore germination cell wall hydrolase CwlJ-like protein
MTILRPSTALAALLVITPQIPSAQALTVLSSEDEQITCMAQNIYFEARSDNYAGQLAVADVVLNRVKDSRYPDTICGVVKDAVLSKWWLEKGKEVPVRDKCQFSWYCDGKADETPDRDAWANSLAVSYTMMYGQHGYHGITEGATHYHATYVDPYWASSNQMKLIGNIGDHVFYRWK